jgi:hypothetical protein
MEYLLTDEELEYCDLQNPITCNHCMNRVAKAQCNKMWLWLNEYCTEHCLLPEFSVNKLLRKNCSMCCAEITKIQSSSWLIKKVPNK